MSLPKKCNRCSGQTIVGWGSEREPLCIDHFELELSSVRTTVNTALVVGWVRATQEPSQS